MNMKIRILYCLTLLIVSLGTGLAQNTEKTSKEGRPAPLLAQKSSTASTAQTGDSAAGQPPENLQVLDLNFPGGTPAQLVKAIEEQSVLPVNVIVPPEYANTMLPALTMKGVTVAQLFEAITMASGHYQANYGFRRVENKPSVNSVWYFYRNEPPKKAEPAKQVRYFHLGRYLNNYSVEDITTAIRTGWKMLNLTSEPDLSFHKETSLLIAYGPIEQLMMIDETLAQLEKGLQNAQAKLPSEAPKTVK